MPSPSTPAQDSTPVASPSTDAATPETPSASASTKPKTTRPSARGTAFYERKRAVRACQVCRARRTKCDNLKPSCSFCLKVGAKCIQSPVDLSSFDPASLKILDRLDEVEALIRELKVSGGAATAQNDHDQPAHKTRIVEATTRPLEAGAQQSLNALNQPLSAFNQPSDALDQSPDSHKQPLEPHQPIENRYILPEPAANILCWHIFAPAVAAARGHFPYASPAFPYALATRHQSSATPAPTPALGMTIGQLTGASPTAAPSPAAASAGPEAHAAAAAAAALDPPKLDPHTINGLLDRFFCYVHVKNPVLDELTTRHLVQTAMAHGPAYSSESCLSLLVCALGAIATPFGPSAAAAPHTPAYVLSRQLFAAAQRHMGALLTAASSHLFSAQSLFLAGVYLMCIFQTEAAWRCFLQSLANCQQFPFLAGGMAHIVRNSSSPVSTNVNGGGAAHTSSSSSSISSSSSSSTSSSSSATSSNSTTTTTTTTSRTMMAPEPVNQTLHQAIYWSAWKSERELRPMMYLPDFTLNNQDRGFYPSFFPEPPPASRYGDEHEHEPAAAAADFAAAPPAAVATSRAGRERLSWYFYLAEISLRRLTTRISSEMLALADAARGNKNAFLAAMADAMPLYEAEKNAWIASLPGVMSFAAAPADDDVCRFVLRGTLINVDDMITWPFVAAFLDSAVHGPAAGAGAGAGATVPLAFDAVYAQLGLDTHLQRLVVNSPGYHHRHHGTIQMVYTCTRSALVLLAAAMVMRQQPGAGPVQMPAGWQDRVRELMDLLVFWRDECPELGERHRIVERAYAMAVAA